MTAIFNLLLVIYLLPGLWAVYELSSEGQLQAKFEPRRLGVKTNSNATIRISLRLAEHSVPLTRNALLLEAGKGKSNSSFYTIPVQFDDNWKAVVNLRFPHAGRYTFFVDFDDFLTNEVQGSLIVHVYHRKSAEYLCYILGWAYFLIWSLSFYPQVWMNHKRKSVVGLSFDFTAINLIGFVPFVVFNALLLFPGRVQNEYFKIHPYSPAPVELNDFVFAIHASILCSITAIQCCVFESGDQRLGWYGNGFIACSVASLVLSGTLFGAKVIDLLRFIYVFSYIKLASTVVKCLPQVYFNFKRKSTIGWSIEAIIMDMLGGAFSFLQQFILAINYSSWSIIYGNVVKLILGVGTILVDIVFIIQHYVLYRNREI